MNKLNFHYKTDKYEIKTDNDGHFESSSYEHGSDSLFETLAVMSYWDEEEFDGLIKDLESNDISWKMLTDQCRNEIMNLTCDDIEHITMGTINDDFIEESFDDMCGNFKIDPYKIDKCIAKYDVAVSDRYKERLIDNIRKNVDLSIPEYCEDHKRTIAEILTEYLDGDSKHFKEITNAGSMSDRLVLDYLDFTIESLEKQTKKEVENMMKGHVSEGRENPDTATPSRATSMEVD